MAKIFYPASSPAPIPMRMACPLMETLEKVLDEAIEELRSTNEKHLSQR